MRHKQRMENKEEILLSSSSNNLTKLLPKLVLICRSNSHPFQERKVTIESSVKVGRAVARSKPAAENAIFDCKVLSRNHALIWYENHKFFLQDTGSSNGTFVNNQRLSPANNESPPKEIHSGDILQFGVDVIENTKKVTHGCIVATVKLYHPDGTEARDTNESSAYSIYGSSNGGLFGLPNGVSNNNCISSKNLYQLAQYLKEALQREELLREKLSSLELIINAAQVSSESGWKSLVEEDRLISRIESLQGRLESLLNSSYSNDEEETVVLKKELVKLHEEKEKYECSAKEIIQKSFEDKMAAYARIFELEASLKTAEVECARLRELCDSLEKDISNLTEKQDKQLQEIEELRSKSKENEDKVSALTETVKQEKNRFDNKGSEYQQRESELEALVAELKEKNEASAAEIKRLKQDLEATKCTVSNSGRNGAGKSDLNFLEPPLGQQKAMRLNRSFPEMIQNTSKLEQQLVNSFSILDGDISLVDSNGSTTLTNGELANHSSNNGEGGSSSSTGNSVSSNSDSCNNGNSKSNHHQSEEESTITTDLVNNVHNNESSHELMSTDIETLKKLLSEARFAKKSVQSNLVQLEKELHTSQVSKKILETQADSLESQLRSIKCKLEEKTRCLDSANSKITMLEEQLTDMQRSNELLNTKLLESERSSLGQQEELRNVKNSLEEERQVQNKVKLVVESLQSELVKLKLKAEDYDCTCEGDLGVLKTKLNSANEDIHDYQLKVQQMTDEVSKLRTECEEYREREEKLQKELASMKEEFEVLSYQNKMASACAIVPILILVLAIVFAYYPDVSPITGTIES